MGFDHHEYREELDRESGGRIHHDDGRPPSLLPSSFWRDRRRPTCPESSLAMRTAQHPSSPFDQIAREPGT
jgi:hypothetical protein